MLAYLGASYFRGHEPTDPLVSPLHGDLAGLPPMFLTASDGEVLLSDTTRLVERAQKAGVDVTSRIVEDSVHVYTIFPFLPETASTMAAIGSGLASGWPPVIFSDTTSQAMLFLRASLRMKSTKQKRNVHENVWTTDGRVGSCFADRRRRACAGNFKRHR
jgi:hypothetical protein